MLILSYENEISFTCKLNLQIVVHQASLCWRGLGKSEMSYFLNSGFTENKISSITQHDNIPVQPSLHDKTLHKNDEKSVRITNNVFFWLFSECRAKDVASSVRELQGKNISWLKHWLCCDMSEFWITEFTRIWLFSRSSTQYTGEIWKRRFHPENASNVFLPQYVREIWKRNNRCSIWICVGRGTQPGKSRVYRYVIVFQKHCFQKHFRPQRASAFKFLRIENRFRRAQLSDFPWRISVDGRPNLRKKLSMA